ncbi:MAG: hypothetical protein V5A24_01645 [Haloarculaceae archaeon]
MRKGQIPLPLLEAAIGVLLLTAMTLVLVTGVPAPPEQEPQLEAYATDAGRLLQSSPPRHANATRLGEVAASRAAFEREREALDRRLERILPDNLLYRVRTPHGVVGYRIPGAIRTGSATLPTAHGPVTIRVWYG